MRNYEIMFIVNPNATEEEIDKINGQVEGIVTSGGGKIEKIEKMENGGSPMKSTSTAKVFMFCL